MSPIDRLLSAITAADVDGREDVWAREAELDATVPNWRMHVRGAAGIRAQLAGWYAHPGRVRGPAPHPIPCCW